MSRRDGRPTSARRPGALGGLGCVANASPPLPWSMLRRAAGWPAAAWLFPAAMLVCLGAAAAGLAPLALKQLIDALDARLSLAEVLTPIAAYGALLFVQRIFEQAQAYLYARGELTLAHSFAKAAFEHLLRLRLAVHLDHRTGSIAGALFDADLGLRLVLGHLMLSVLPLLVQLIVAGAVVSGDVGPDIGIVLVLALATYASAFASGVRRLDQPLRTISTANLEANGAAVDSLTNIEAVKLYVAEDHCGETYAHALGVAARGWRAFHLRRCENGLVVGLIFAATASTALYLLGAAVLRGELTLGSLVMLNLYLLQIVRPVEMLGFAIRDIGQGLSRLYGLARLLDHELEPAGHEATSSAPAGPADLIFDEVAFSYGEGRAGLQAVSFRARPGQTIAIVGRSGAGKSSIVRLLAGLYEPDSGEIRLDGRAIQTIGLTALRRQIAVVSQDTILLNASLAANIGLADPTQGACQIAAAAAAARLDALIEACPAGLATEVGERGLKLSGGERQRVAIARAVLKQGRLMVFDEATAALDPATGREIWRSVEKAGNGATRLIVTHRLDLARDADEILVLDEGRIVERGRHGALLTANGLYAALWRAQSAHAQDAP